MFGFDSLVYPETLETWVTHRRLSENVGRVDSVWHSSNPRDSGFYITLILCPYFSCGPFRSDSLLFMYLSFPLQNHDLLEHFLYVYLPVKGQTMPT